ncbi:MAG TPA: hypothetical protein EYN88_03190 [Candidatus Poseidoniales archaeon]|nr:hypothetical protein [Candidatus Poseidoniales archaeon]
MELTTWQIFCHRILGRSLKKKARADVSLNKQLDQAGINIMPEVYLAVNIVSTIAVSLISIAIVAIFFVPEIGIIAFWESLQDPLSQEPCRIWEYWNKDIVAQNQDVAGHGCPDYESRVFPPAARIIIPVTGGLLIPWFSFKYFKGTAKREAKLRGAALEKYLPYASSYTAAMSAANASPQIIFRSLSMNEEIYGDIAYDAGLIYRDITLLGFDLITAIKMSVDRAASPWLTDFFQGMVGTLTSGGNLKLYFLNRAEHYSRENRTRLQMFLETLALLAESYIVVAVAMPLFLIVMLVIMFWVSGSGSQITEGQMYLIILGVLPMIHIAYSAMIWLMSQEQKM